MYINFVDYTPYTDATSDIYVTKLIPKLSFVMDTPIELLNASQSHGSTIRVGKC